MISDADLIATLIADEAGNQPYEGKVAVAIVVENRTRLKYASNGTPLGTALHKWAFSGFWAQMVHGVYTQTAFDLPGAEAQAARLCAGFSADTALWNACNQARLDAVSWAAGLRMSFTPGPAFAGLTKRTVLYLNPAIVHPLPAWAAPENQDAVIFAHTFFHDGTNQ